MGGPIGVFFMNAVLLYLLLSLLNKKKERAEEKKKWAEGNGTVVADEKTANADADEQGRVNAANRNEAAD